jgi:hypothetical protein
LTYFVVYDFVRDIRAASVYFDVYELFWLFMLVVRYMSGDVSAGPLRACVKVDICLIHFLQVH